MCIAAVNIPENPASGENSSIENSQESKDENVDIKAEEKAKNPIPTTNEQEKSLIERYGPTVKQYFIEFCFYLRARTKFDPKNFTTPDHLQQTMERLEKYQIPLKIWETVLNVSMRLLGYQNKEFTEFDLFLEIFMAVVSMVVCYYFEYLLVQAALWLLHLTPSKVLRGIIVTIYHCIIFAFHKLWAYVEAKIKEYLSFIYKKLKSLPAVQLYEP